MTYFYKVHGTIARKIGGDPPANEYVAIDPKGILRHIKNGEIIEETSISYPTDITVDTKDLYKDEIGKMLARDMLFPKYRKAKNTKSKSRKIKVVKKCKCK
jgi:hypothetical protein